MEPSRDERVLRSRRTRQSKDCLKNKEKKRPENTKTKMRRTGKKCNKIHLAPSWLEYLFFVCFLVDSRRPLHPRCPACGNRLKFPPQAFNGEPCPSCQDIQVRFLENRDSNQDRSPEQLPHTPRRARSTNFDKSLVNRMSGFLKPASPLSSRCSSRTNKTR